MDKKSNNHNDVKTILPMIVYTSGFLHLGHARSYTACDVVHRWQLLKHGESLMPFGYDAHGLPTETKAREEGLHPLKWTSQCIQDMGLILKKMNLLFTSVELNTSDPRYYCRQQEIFIELWKANLIYLKKSFVFWDPLSLTTLANEQVIEGRAERSGALVEEKEMEQWFFDLPYFAEDIQNSLETLSWPIGIKNSQKEWINFHEWLIFEIEGIKIKISSRLDSISFFEANLNLFPSTKKELNILGFSLPIIHTKSMNGQFFKGCFSKTAILDIGLLKEHFVHSIEKSSNLREWCISRQRSFGCPIPAMRCSNCGLVVDASLISINPLEKEDYKSNLGLFPKWSMVDCPKCGKRGSRESDTLDVLFDSSWYPLWYQEKGLGSLPITTYIGGREHATGHLIYLRTMFRALNKIGFDVPLEPVIRFFSNGMINNPVYKNKKGEYIYPEEVIYQGKQLVDKWGEEVVEFPSSKMSKSKKNIVKLDSILENYSADEVRTAILSDYPLEKDFNWSWNLLQGVRKNLLKIREFLNSSETYPLVQDPIVDKLYEKCSFNKIIAHAYTILKGPKNFITQGQLAYTIAPIAPQIVENCGLELPW